MKPSFYICGGGGNIPSGCEHWDDINGCWLDYANVEDCPMDLNGEDEEGDDEYND